MEFITFRDPPQWRQDIELDGETFILTFQWNTLNEFWSMNIYDQDLEPIVLGIKIVTQWDLTEQIVRAEMPSGEILCLNIIGGFDKIERYDMGRTNKLVYVSEDDEI